MTLHHHRCEIAGTPAIVVHRGDGSVSAARGTVLFHHGLSACKETNVKELESIADHGFLAVGLDAVGHGARRFDDFERRFSGDNPALEEDFLSVVLATARETPAVVDELVARWGSHEERMGIGGISMGGHVSYAALLEDERLSVAAPVLGSPRWKLSWPESPHRHLDRFWPRAILSQNGGQDRSVPPESARLFHEELAAYYEDALHLQLYVEYPESGHFMREVDWNVLWGRVLDWFDIHLAPRVI